MTKRAKVGGLFVFLFILIATLLVLRFGRQVLSPRTLQPGPATFNAVRSVHSLRAEAPAGVDAWPQVAPLNDAMPLPNGFLLAGEGGLALADARAVTVFHQGAGLPVSHLLRLLRTTEGVYALAVEGLLKLEHPLEPHNYQLEVTLIRPAGAVRFVDGAVIDDHPVLLDEQGRLLTFVEKKFQLLAELPPDPRARLGVLHDMPLIVSGGSVFLVRDGAAKRVHQLPAPHETATALVFVDDRALIGSMNGLLAATEYGMTSLLNDIAVSAVARFGERMVLGGVHGELLDDAGATLAACPSAVRRLLVDGQRLLIVAADGLYQWDGAHDPTPATPNELLRPWPEGYVTALLPLPDGRVLVGTLNRGLVAFDPATATTGAARLSDFGVNRIVADDAGYWVATTNGLARLDDALAERRWLKLADGLPGRNIAAVLATDKGLFLAGNAGLGRLSAAGLQAIDAFHGLAGNHLYCLAADDRGNLLAGGLAGLSLLGGSEGLTVTKIFTAAQGLPHNWINAVLRAENGWWVGTYGGGVGVLTDEGAWRGAPDTASWSVNVNCAAALGSLTVFGTLENALALGRDSRRMISFAAGLPSRNVTALAVAGGTLWVGTDHGLARLDASVLDSALH
ncbi:MAG TPA: hypothetical protein PKW95_17020 [bacterium]|nr:hypothetical protein [bacterium]